MTNNRLIRALLALVVVAATIVVASPVGAQDELAVAGTETSLETTDDTQPRKGGGEAIDDTVEILPVVDDAPAEDIAEPNEPEPVEETPAPEESISDSFVGCVTNDGVLVGTHKAERGTIRGTVTRDGAQVATVVWERTGASDVTRSVNVGAVAPVRITWAQGTAWWNAGLCEEPPTTTQPERDPDPSMDCAVFVSTPIDFYYIGDPVVAGVDVNYEHTTITSVQLDFGDGTVLPVTNGQRVDHVYNTPGTYTITGIANGDRVEETRCTDTVTIVALPELDRPDNDVYTTDAGCTTDFQVVSGWVRVQGNHDANTGNVFVNGAHIGEMDIPGAFQVDPVHLTQASNSVQVGAGGTQLTFPDGSVFGTINVPPCVRPTITDEPDEDEPDTDNPTLADFDFADGQQANGELDCRIIIPALNVDEIIVGVDQHSDERGRFITATGEVGTWTPWGNPCDPETTTMIGAHVTDLFAGLGEIAEGEVFYLASSDRLLTYRFTAKTPLDKDEVDFDQIRAEGGVKVMTCEGPIGSNGHRVGNLIWTTELVFDSDFMVF